MTATIAAAVLAAVTMSVGSGSTIKYPSQLLVGGVAPANMEKWCPYPKQTPMVGEDDGGWTSGRLSQGLGCSMYGSFDAILQRRILPFWYCWGKQNTIDLSKAAEADFNLTADIFAHSIASNRWKYAADKFADLFFFDPGLKYLVYYASDKTNAQPASVLGEYGMGTNRDFSAAGPRVWKANQLVAQAITNGYIGLDAPFDVSGSSGAHYWLAQDSIADNLVVETGFVADPLGAADWKSTYFMFVGDYDMSGFFPTRTFNRLGYAELRDIHPGWATSYYTAKGYKCFADIFSDSLQSQGGGRITESVSALINGGVGTAWLNGVYKKPQTSRITIDRFALVNSAASLCQTAFLGTQTADWGQLLWYDADPLFPTQPCALFNYSSIVYSGFLKATNTIPVYVSAVRIGDGSSLQWKLVGDLSSALDRLTSADLSFSGGITSVVTQNCSSVSVGWYDETASAGISGKFEAGIALSDIAIEYPLTGFPDPFENDPAAAEGQWKLVSTVMGEDQLIIIGIEPAEIWIDDDHWGPDPKAVFADGSTSKTLAQGYIRPRDGMGDVLDLYMSVDLAFKGREFVAPCPWMGPTQGKDPEYDGSGKNDHCLLPVTFNQQLYSAGLVRTALPSYTSVGVQANLAAAASVADSNLFEFPSTLETDAAVYTKYAPAPMKFGSKVGWENGWRSFVEKADVDADIAACIAESMKGSQTFDPTKFLHTYDPTSAAALGGYGSNKHALDTMMSSLRSSFATDDATTAEIVQGTFQPNSYESITDGVIPADYHLGIVTFHVRFAPDKDKLSDVRRSSYAAAWDKKALPLAYWNFPAMKVVE